jgi:hypothetical protein
MQGFASQQALLEAFAQPLVEDESIVLFGLAPRRLRRVHNQDARCVVTPQAETPR